jgi:hypothetical protein
MSNRKSTLHPVPKNKGSNGSAREAQIIDLLWKNEEAQTLMGQAADQLEAAAHQLAEQFDLELVEAVLWITETVCARADLPPLVYPDPLP